MGNTIREMLQVENMGDLVKFSEKELQQLIGDKNGYGFFNLYYKSFSKQLQEIMRTSIFQL